MIIVRNRVIPFGGYDAMALWPFVFTKGSATERTVRHERIHGEQQKELLLVGFYVLYSLFFLFLLVKHWNWDKAYRANPFEREAYFYGGDEGYLDRRHHFSWIRFLA
jgi:hypothetical protein